MRVPCRVLKGTNGAEGSFFWDGVHAMTQLSGGIGAILVDNDGFDLPTVTLTPTNFDNLQNYLMARDTVRAEQIAAAVNS